MLREKDSTLTIEVVKIAGRVDPSGGQNVEVTGVGPALGDERAVVGGDVTLVGQHGEGAVAAGAGIDAGIIDGGDCGGLLVLGVGYGAADGGQDAEDDHGNQRHHLGQLMSVVVCRWLFS